MHKVCVLQTSLIRKRSVAHANRPQDGPKVRVLQPVLTPCREPEDVWRVCPPHVSGACPAHHCRIEPFWIKAAPHAAPLARRQPLPRGLGGPGRRTPGHTGSTRRSRPLTRTQVRREVASSPPIVPLTWFWRLEERNRAGPDDRDRVKHERRPTGHLSPGNKQQ